MGGRVKSAGMKMKGIASLVIVSKKPSYFGRVEPNQNSVLPHHLLPHVSGH